MDKILATLAQKQAHSIDGLIKFENMLEKDSCVLDIGAGKKQFHANYLRLHGHTVDPCDLHKGATYRGDFQNIDLPTMYDGAWVAHCLEHQLNVNIFLRKLNFILKPNGVLCITVPPLKQNIVSGHMTLWNAGLLLYNLVLAEFDCSDAKIKTYGYNISVALQKRKIELPNTLKYDKPDLITLSKFFPKELSWDKYNRRGFDGDIESLNWDNDD